MDDTLSLLGMKDRDRLFSEADFKSSEEDIAQNAHQSETC